MATNKIDITKKAANVGAGALAKSAAKKAVTPKMSRIAAQKQFSDAVVERTNKAFNSIKQRQQDAKDVAKGLNAAQAKKNGVDKSKLKSIENRTVDKSKLTPIKDRYSKASSPKRKNYTK